MLGSVGFAFLMLLSQIGAATEQRAEYDYFKYHPMTEITDWMDQITKENPSLVTMVPYGETYENRTINLLKIGESTGATKKAIWMDCGIHAREWIAPAFCQFFVREILQASKTDPKMQQMMKNMDFYVTPVLNMDGYIYSWKDNTTRLWRKSRMPAPEGTCECFGGTDLNRNFDSNWGTVGTSPDCCSNIYPGHEPKSDPETRAVTDYVLNMKDNVLCFLTIHSYSQLILIPYGHPNESADNIDELRKVGQAAADAIEEIHGMVYKVGRSTEILYANSGSSRDWAHQIGIPLSFTFELRDNGTHGFELPEDQIQPACEEAYAGALHIAQYAHDKAFPAPTTTPTTAAPGSATTAAPGSATTAAPGSATTTAPGSATTAAPGGAAASLTATLWITLWSTLLAAFITGTTAL